ncbi:hypothetical protein [Chromobacterium violaceum]|uniref:hypothetical protein n=1 Tax=Chromobacterium violaceum TaxID=536 RepID=UPI00194E6DCB|nr:hypothetical protein [Chromobacterium violaceum]MBX9267183.1 hypothetical protein [Chromobacterium violaceum]QRO33945.1 hypothetical protein I6K04_04170 [Chromobacterium violaceum]QRQ16251.1 hypothetical protein I6K03_18560 [Chromobacterium violaceum]
MSEPYLYEFLVRGTPAGIAGAHAIYATETKNVLTGESRTETGLALPVALLAGAAGEQLGDIAAALNINALVEVESLRRQLAERDAENADLRAQLVNASAGSTS